MSEIVSFTKVISFTKVHQPYGWLGNMSPHPIIINRAKWRTAEALFQALRFDDYEIQEAIRAQTSPMAAKLVAKRHKNKLAIQPRSSEDLDIMHTVLKLKLQQHRKLRRRLLETDDATLIEDCTKRAGISGLYWGAALRHGSWVGKNHLGKLWMKLRADLKQNI